MSKLMHNKVIGFIFSVLWTYLFLMLSQRYIALAVPIYLMLPCVLAVYTAVQGRNTGVLSALTVCALTALVPYNSYSMMLAAWTGLTGVLMGIMFLRKTRTKKLVVFTSVAYLVLVGGAIALYNWFYHTNLIENWLGMLSGLTEQMIQMLMDTAALSELPDSNAEIEAIATAFRSYPGMINDNFPAYIVIISAILGYIYFVLTKRWMRLSKVDVSFVRPFSEYRLPKSMAVFVMLLVIVSMLTSDYLPMMFHYNLTNILLFLFGVSGLAYLEWLLKKRGIPLAVRLLLLLALIIIRMVLPIIDIFQILMIIGILDTFINFRGKRGVRH